MLGWVTFFVICHAGFCLDGSGSHGAGSRDETEVPLLAWGAGVKGPRHSDPWDPVSIEEWQLSHLKRKDVNQADIVALLASLIGCNIPVNSVVSDM